MANAQLKKVLRIGVIQDGKIVQERLIAAGESVSVGESAKNTFVLPKTSLKKTEFPLFLAHGKGYVLQFNDQMKGKLSCRGNVLSLERVRSDPNTARKGNVCRLGLTNQDRGKIIIDNITVLFQFVPPPPAQAVRAIQAMDFRPRMIEDDDPVFYAFLALSAVLGFAFSIWVAIAPPVDVQGVVEVPDRFVKMIVDPKTPKEKPTEEIVITDDSMISQQKSQQKDQQSVSKAESAPKNKAEQVAQAKQREQRKQEVAENSMLIKMLTTRGEGTGTAENLWSDADAGLGDLDSVAQNASGIKVATEANKGLRSGSGISSDEVDIGELASVGGGTATVASGPAVTVVANVDLGDADMSDVSDAGGVKSVVKSKFGQLKYCYEKSLKANPQLRGRVEVEFNVKNRRVTSASVFANTTGDAEFANCIVGKIKRWKFPDSVEGQILYPFIFSPKS